MDTIHVNLDVILNEIIKGSINAELDKLKNKAGDTSKAIKNIDISKPFQDGIKDINLATKQYQKFSSMVSGKNKAQLGYYTDRKTMQQQFDAAFKGYTVTKSNSKKENFASQMSHWVEASRARGWNLNVSQDAQKIVDSKVQNLVENYSRKKDGTSAYFEHWGESYFKELFKTMDEMVVNGFDMSEYADKYNPNTLRPKSDVEKRVNAEIIKNKRANLPLNTTQRLEEIESFFYDWRSRYMKANIANGETEGSRASREDNIKAINQLAEYIHLGGDISDLRRTRSQDVTVQLTELLNGYLSNSEITGKQMFEQELYRLQNKKNNNDYQKYYVSLDKCVAEIARLNQTTKNFSSKHPEDIQAANDFIGYIESYLGQGGKFEDLGKDSKRVENAYNTLTNKKVNDRYVGREQSNGVKDYITERLNQDKKNHRLTPTEKEERDKQTNSLTLSEDIPEKQENKALREQVAYLKEIKNLKFSKTSGSGSLPVETERKQNYEARGWDVKESKAEQYAEICKNVENASNAINDFDSKYKQVLVTMNDGHQVAISSSDDLKNITLNANRIKDISFFRNIDKTTKDTQQQIDEISDSYNRQINRKTEEDFNSSKASNTISELQSLVEKSNQLKTTLLSIDTSDIMENDIISIQTQISSLDQIVENATHSINEFSELKTKLELDESKAQNTSTVNNTSITDNIKSLEQTKKVLQEIVELYDRLSKLDIGYNAQQESLDLHDFFKEVMDSYDDEYGGSSNNFSSYIEGIANSYGINTGDYDNFHVATTLDLHTISATKQGIDNFINYVLDVTDTIGRIQYVFENLGIDLTSNFKHLPVEVNKINGVLNKDFSVSGKREATTQLKSSYTDYLKYYSENDDLFTENSIVAKYAYLQSLKQAHKNKVAHSTLDRYGIGKYKDYSEFDIRWALQELEPILQSYENLKSYYSKDFNGKLPEELEKKAFQMLFADKQYHDADPFDSPAYDPYISILKKNYEQLKQEFDNLYESLLKTVNESKEENLESQKSIDKKSKKQSNKKKNNQDIPDETITKEDSSSNAANRLHVASKSPIINTDSTNSKSRSFSDDSLEHLKLPVPTNQNINVPFKGDINIEHYEGEVVGEGTSSKNLLIRGINKFNKDFNDTNSGDTSQINDLFQKFYSESGMEIDKIKFTTDGSFGLIGVSIKAFNEATQHATTEFWSIDKETGELTRQIISLQDDIGKRRKERKKTDEQYDKNASETSYGISKDLLKEQVELESSLDTQNLSETEIGNIKNAIEKRKQLIKAEEEYRKINLLDSDDLDNDLRIFEGKLRKKQSDNKNSKYIKDWDAAIAENKQREDKKRIDVNKIISAYENAIDKDFNAQSAVTIKPDSVKNQTKSKIAKEERKKTGQDFEELYNHISEYDDETQKVIREAKERIDQKKKEKSVELDAIKKDVQNNEYDSKMKNGAEKAIKDEYNALKEMLSIKQKIANLDKQEGEHTNQRAKLEKDLATSNKNYENAKKERKKYDGYYDDDERKNKFHQMGMSFESKTTGSYAVYADNVINNAHNSIDKYYDAKHKDISHSTDATKTNVEKAFIKMNDAYENLVNAINSTADDVDQTLHKQLLKAKTDIDDKRKTVFNELGDKELKFEGNNKLQEELSVWKQYKETRAEISRLNDEGGHDTYVEYLNQELDKLVDKLRKIRDERKQFSEAGLIDESIGEQYREIADEVKKKDEEIRSKKRDSQTVSNQREYNAQAISHINQLIKSEREYQILLARREQQNVLSKKEEERLDFLTQQRSEDNYPHSEKYKDSKKTENKKAEYDVKRSEEMSRIESLVDALKNNETANKLKDEIKNIKEKLKSNDISVEIDSQIDKLNKDFFDGKISIDAYNQSFLNLINNAKSIKGIIKDLNPDKATDEIKKIILDNKKTTEEMQNLKLSNKNNGVITATATFLDSESNSMRTLTYEANLATGAVRELDDTIQDANQHSSSHSENKISNFIDGIGNRFKSLAEYLATFGSFYEVFDYVEQGIQVVRDFDTALTEMRKVSDESVGTLKDFQKESFDMGDSVGTTALQIQQSTADFMRLGFV